MQTFKIIINKNMEQDKYYIHDFIENYEDYYDDDIQWKTSSREEFLELRGFKKENPPEPGKFFKHQDLFFRYGRFHDRILNIHETGTGKTGSIINLTEYLRKNEPDRIRRVFVLEPGPPTVEDFKDQLIKLSSDEAYKRLLDIEEEKTYKNNMTRMINKNYEITTYQRFVKDNITTQEINEYYDDCIFFLDEAHKLRNLSDTSGTSLTTDMIDKIYNYLWKVVHTAKRIKVVVATATPMINEIDDFVPLINILLPADRQFPNVKESSFYENLSLSQVEPFFRGMITYVRFLDTGIKINNKGETAERYSHSVTYPKESKSKPIFPVKKEIVNEKIVVTPETQKYEKSRSQPKNELVVKKIPSQITIYPLEMSSIQLKVAEIVQKKKNDSFYREARQSAVFVFPNQEYGRKGFQTYIKRDEFGDFRFKDNIFQKGKQIASMNQFIDPNNLESTFKNLSKLSCKFTDYIKREMKRSETERPGNSFCYLELVEGSGVVLLGLILERLGFENFRSNDSSIIDSRRNKIRESFPKKKRFALLTGKTNNLRTALKIFNHPDNMDGNYIQMIIASEMARDGINLHNVIRGYIMAPGWHESGMHQALSRFIRATSHEDLKNRYLLEKGSKNPNHRINVDIYRMAAIKPSEKLETGKEFSVDLKNYINAERKDINNKRILRYMKQCAFDAYLNYDRNVRNSDEPYSKETDYGPKYLEIWKARGKPGNEKRKGLAMNQGPSPSDYVFNTYNIYYSDEKRELIRPLILSLQKQYNLASIDNIITLVKEKYPKLDLYTIYNTIIEVVAGKERNYNFNSTIPLYTKILGNQLYLENEQIFESIGKLNTEDNYIFNAEDESKIEIDLEDSVALLYKKLENLNKSQIIDYYMTEQNYLEFKFLLEDILIRRSRGEDSKLIRNIMELFSNYFMFIKIPENWLQTAKDALSSSGDRKQGRKRTEGSLAGFKTLDLDKVKPGYSKEGTFIHFYRESDKTGFSITSILEGKVRRIRILEGDHFRNSSDVEQFVYTHAFDKFYEKLLEQFKEYPYYGSYIYRGGEQIDDVIKRKREFFRIIDTSNPRNKGRVCSSLDVTMVQKILKSVDKEKKYKKYYTGKISKNEVCEHIKTVFKEKNLLFISL
jgi:hypothetical protein